MQKIINSSKILYLEVLRVIAIFFVLYAHTGERGKVHYQIAGMAISYNISMVLLCITQICNMLFWAISGALLLHREESLKKTMQRFGKMLILVVIFSIFQYYCTYLKVPEMGFDIWLGLKLTYSEPIITQYWYLYSYLGFLLMLPFLRILAKHMENKHYYYFFVIFILTKGILPVLERYWENNPLYIDVPMLTMLIVFPLLGYFLAHRAEELWKNKKNIILLNVSALLALLISVREANIAYRTEGNPEYILLGLVLIYMAAIFVDIKLLCEHFKMPKWLRQSFYFAGNGVFGVYLLERQIKDNLTFIYDYLEPRTNWIVAVFCWLAVSIFAGVIVTNCLKKIPLLKKIL